MSLTQTETLKGINAAYVSVQDLSDGTKVLGLARETILTDIELKLRLAGMRVVTEDEAANDVPGSPCVFVRTFLASANVSFVDIKLMQSGWLDRNAESVFSPTWQKFVLAVGGKIGAQDIRDQIKDIVDMFLNDWLSVNPRG
jgi:hypothetical protein